MKNIYGFECGKQTEKDVKAFLGLPQEVSKAGEIDVIYNGITCEVKRGACALYVGKRFNRNRNANNVITMLMRENFYTVDDENAKGSALAKSERIIYSIDGTLENTYCLGTGLFLSFAAPIAKLYKTGKGTKILRIVPNEAFLWNIRNSCLTLAQWKARQDAKEARKA